MISYETGGTFDPRKKGPTTQWGQHRGLIQFGEPQARQYGANFSTEQTALDSQLGPNGAVVKYIGNSHKIEGVYLFEWKNTLNKNWVIDHDHSCCGEVYSYSKNVKRVFCGNCNRDLLCNNCNTAIGLLKENKTSLNNAIIYLDKYST